MKKILLTIVCLLFVNIACAFEEQDLSKLKSTPFQFSFWAPSQFPDDVELVKGVRLGLYGKTRYVSGLDICLWGETTEVNSGAQFGFVNIDKTTTGMRLGLVNISDESAGLQVAFFQKARIANCPTIGILYNEARVKATGDMIGLVNNAGELIGIQFGALNTAKKLISLQIGIINIADKQYTGMQLGLINISNGGFFPFIKF